jgi:hypothetical protein
MSTSTTALKSPVYFLNIGWGAILVVLHAALFVMAYYGIVTLTALWATAHASAGGSETPPLAWPDVLTAFDWRSTTIVCLLAILWAAATTRFGVNFGRRSDV